MPRTISTTLALACLAVTTPQATSTALTFLQRVDAQERIERVLYSHRTGDNRPFEETVSKQVLEDKVRTYLEQSVALDRFWNTPVTAQALQRELERIRAESLFPQRLAEVYAALDNDPVLVLETLARATLVDRLTRSFFSADERIHMVSRQKGQKLRSDLLTGKLDPRREDPRRAGTCQ